MVSQSLDVEASAGVRTRSPAFLAWLLLLLLLTHILNYSDRQLLVILIEPIKREFGASDTAMGALTGIAFTLVYVALSLPVARLADRWSKRNVLCLSAALWSAMTALSGAAGQFWQLAVARFGVGIGEAGGLPPSQSLIAAYFPLHWRARALAILSSGATFASFVGIYGGALANELYGWRAAFFVLGLPGILVALLILLTVPEPLRTSAPPQASRMRDVLALCLKSRSIVYACLGIGTGTIAPFGLLTWLPSFFIRVHGLSATDVGLVMGIGNAIGGGLGLVFGAHLVDRMAQRRPAMALLVPALGFLLCYPLQVALVAWPESQTFVMFAKSWPIAAIFVPLNSFFGMFWSGPTFAMAQSLVPAGVRTQANALVLTIYMLIGQSLGPLVVGMISDLFNAGPGNPQALRYALLVVLTTNLIAAGFYWLGSRHYPRERAERQVLAES